MQKMLCVGEIVNTHGVRGELKVVPLLDNSEDLGVFKSTVAPQAPSKIEVAITGMIKHFRFIKSTSLWLLAVRQNISGGVRKWRYLLGKQEIIKMSLW